MSYLERVPLFLLSSSICCLISSKIMKHVPNYLFVFIQCLSEQELIYFQIILGTGTIYHAQTTPKVYWKIGLSVELHVQKDTFGEARVEKVNGHFNYFQTINYSFIDIPKNTYYGKKVFKDQKKKKNCFHCDSNNLEFHRYSHPGFVLLKQSLCID